MIKLCNIAGNYIEDTVTVVENAIEDYIVTLKENEKHLKELMNGYKKLKNSKLISEKFETKEYVKNLTVEEARAVFKHRTSMTRYTKFNYKNDSLYARQLWKCESCDNISTESHILWCSGFKHLREGLDLKSDKDLANYLLEVVNIRSKN